MIIYATAYLASLAATANLTWPYVTLLKRSVATTEVNVSKDQGLSSIANVYQVTKKSDFVNKKPSCAAKKYFMSLITFHQSVCKAMYLYVYLSKSVESLNSYERTLEQTGHTTRSNKHFFSPWSQSGKTGATSHLVNQFNFCDVV